MGAMTRFGAALLVALASAVAVPSPEERGPVELMAPVTAQEEPASAAAACAETPQAEHSPFVNAVPADAPGGNTAAETPANDPALRQGELP